MKKTKRKILYIVIVFIASICTLISFTDETVVLSSSIEAMASGENTKYDCDVNPGFCIINGIAQPGVTYKE